MRGALQSVPGLYGKVPAAADFVRRQLPKSFVEPWDGWLHTAMTRSREQLADAWLEVYLTSPIWRFALSPDLCGPEVAIGVVMPSVDAVGRHYPLVIAIQLPDECNILDVAAHEPGWFLEAEETALSLLRDEIPPEDFQRKLDTLGSPKPPDRSLEQSSVLPPPVACGNHVWHMEEKALSALGFYLYPHALDDFARSELGSYSIWWSTGSDRVQPSFFFFPGLPPAENFAALFWGDTTSEVP